MGEKLVSVPEKPELQAPVYDGGGMGESGSVCTGGAGEQDKGALGGGGGDLNQSYTLPMSILLNQPSPLSYIE